MEKEDLGVQDGIMCFSERFYSDLSKDMKGRHRKAPDLPGAFKGFVAGDVAVYLSHMGAPASAMLFEVMMASGIRRLLMLGMAGSISEDCHIGDIVIPTWGIREEGTSYHYLPPDDRLRPSPSMVKMIRKDFAALGVREGGVWTIDAPYRETAQKIDRYARMGVLAVEMECTALMAVAQYRRRQFGAVLVITDELRKEGWREAFAGRKVRQSRERMCVAAAACFC